MKKQIARVSVVSSMTDRRIDSGQFARRAVKNALSSVRGLYGKIRREVTTRGYEKIEAGKLMGTSTLRMQMAEDELWNLRNENLENELKELAMKRT